MLGYNRMTGYNKARYNAEGSELSAADSFTVSDNTVTKSSQKIKSELVILSETIAKQQNKSVTDAITLHVWQSQDRSDSNKWSD